MAARYRSQNSIMRRYILHATKWFVHGRAVAAKMNCGCYLLNHKLAGVDGAFDIEPAVRNDDLVSKLLPEAIKIPHCGA
jgi:hypothetical protein